jgi:hypothetical protein
VPLAMSSRSKGAPVANKARLGRLCAVARLAGPGTDLTVDPVDELCELIEAELGIFIDGDAVLQLMGACTAVRFWAGRNGRVAIQGKFKFAGNDFSPLW